MSYLWHTEEREGNVRICITLHLDHLGVNHGSETIRICSSLDISVSVNIQVEVSLCFPRPPL